MSMTWIGVIVALFWLVSLLVNARSTASGWGWALYVPSTLSLIVCTVLLCVIGHNQVHQWGLDLKEWSEKAQKEAPKTPVKIEDFRESHWKDLVELKDNRIKLTTGAAAKLPKEWKAAVTQDQKTGDALAEGKVITLDAAKPVWVYLFQKKRVGGRVTDEEEIRFEAKLRD